MTSGEAKLADNLRLILGTRLGERPMMRRFGSPLHDLVHEPNDGSLARLITRHARDTLAQLEPRILIADLTVGQRRGELVMELIYATADRPQPQQLLVPLG
jgi:phage baseplate assembly protein W